MTKEPLPSDVMAMLIQLARKDPDTPDTDDPYGAPDDPLRRRRAYREASRARFNAAFSVCAGMATDHPDLALHWLEALKLNQPWRRVKQVNMLRAEIIRQLVVERQMSLF